MAAAARAQMPSDAMGLPIPTTIVLAKPAPGETYQGRLLITVGVGATIYKFVLKDGYTNHIYVKWASIWQHVRQSSPNLIAEGLNAEKFAEVEPGATVTISGMFTPGTTQLRNYQRRRRRCRRRRYRCGFTPSVCAPQHHRKVSFSFSTK